MLSVSPDIGVKGLDVYMLVCSSKHLLEWIDGKLKSHCVYHALVWANQPLYWQSWLGSCFIFRMKWGIYKLVSKLENCSLGPFSKAHRKTVDKNTVWRAAKCCCLLCLRIQPLYSSTKMIKRPNSSFCFKAVSVLRRDAIFKNYPNDSVCFPNSTSSEELLFFSAQRFHIKFHVCCEPFVPGMPWVPLHITQPAQGLKGNLAEVCLVKFFP